MVYGRTERGDMMAMTVAEKLAVIMKRRKMTMGELAAATGQSRQNLSNKVSRGNFTEKDIEKLAAALGCTVEIRFITEDGEEI